MIVFSICGPLIVYERHYFSKADNGGHLQTALTNLCEKINFVR